MSTHEIPPSPPQSEAAFRPATAQLSRLAIDQAIVDGVVDGIEKRAPMKMLIEIAFEGSTRVESPMFEDFREGLVTDARYKDTLGNLYGFYPVLDNSTTLRPRPVAILEGTASVTEEERQEVRARMEEYARLALRSSSDPPLSLEAIRARIVAFGVELSYLEFGALRSFIRDDPRFVPTVGGIVYRPGRRVRPTPPQSRPEQTGPDLDERIAGALAPQGEGGRRGRNVRRRGS